MAIHPDELKATISDLDVDLLAEGDVESSLREVVSAALVLFSAAGAGLMLVDDSEALHYVAATDARAAALEAAQEESGEGPCVDSLINDVLVQCDDLSNDERWPTVRETIHPLGVRAILGVPVRIGGSAVGSFNTYHDHAHTWDDTEIVAVTAFGKVIEQLLAQALLAAKRNDIVEQLEYALRNRVDIERAVGVMMARDGLNPVKAFDTLRRRARDERKKVADLAREILSDPSFH
jgi:GAF domain-containing protein